MRQRLCGWLLIAGLVQLLGHFGVTVIYAQTLEQLWQRQELRIDRIDMRVNINEREIGVLQSEMEDMKLIVRGITIAVGAQLIVAFIGFKRAPQEPRRHILAEDE